MLPLEILNLMQAIGQICEENGYIGFVGAFRSKDGYHNFSLEHPDFSDGECVQLGDTLQNAIVAAGATLFNQNKGIVTVPKPDNRDMPH